VWHYWLVPLIIAIVAGILIVGVRRGWWVAIIFRGRE
jgi:hypothetical protein